MKGIKMNIRKFFKVFAALPEHATKESSPELIEQKELMDIGLKNYKILKEFIDDFDLSDHTTRITNAAFVRILYVFSEKLSYYLNSGVSCGQELSLIMAQSLKETEEHIRDAVKQQGPCGCNPNKSEAH